MKEYAKDRNIKNINVKAKKNWSDDLVLIETMPTI